MSNQILIEMKSQECFVNMLCLKNCFNLLSQLKIQKSTNGGECILNLKEDLMQRLVHIRKLKILEE